MAAVFVKEYFFIGCNSAYRRFLSIRLTAEKSHWTELSYSEEGENKILA
jgi:hypothetical protein